MQKFKSIKIYSKTKKQLDSIKLVPMESYDNLINRLISSSSITGDLKNEM